MRFQNMDENKQQTSLKDDEFDLEILASKIWRLYKKALYKLFYPVRLIWLNPKKLWISLSIAMALSIVLRFTIPPIFESTFIIKPYNVTDVVSSIMLEDLNTMIKDDNYPDLSKNLKLSEELCENLFRLSIKPQYKNEFRKDSIIGIQITLLLNNPRLIDTFQNAILKNYLEENEYFKRIVDIRRQDLNEFEKTLVKEILDNDSLKRVVTTNAIPRNGGGGFVYGEPLDPQKVYQLGYDLQQQLLKVRTAKQYNLSFELAKSGIVRLKPFFPRMVILFPILGLIALIYCMVSNAKSYKKENI
ncbi:MAG: hypothetical protein KA981_06930 [Bacteroidia bacterium]|nr:hypothetical protein [Bacteroidia bacterium]